MRWWLPRLGIFPRARRRALWIHGAAPERFAAAAPLLAALCSAYPRLSLCLSSRSPATRRWLESRYRGELVVPPPWGVRMCIRRFVRNARPIVLLLLDTPDGLPTRVLGRVRRRAIGVALVDGGSSRGLDQRLHVIDRFCMRSAEDAKHLLEAGATAEQVIHVEGLGSRSRSPPSQRAVREAAAVQRTLDALQPLVRRDLPKGRAARRGNPWGWRQRLVASKPGRRMLARRGDRIASFDELRERLGAPGTILCLGNGPSSEDPQLLELEFDALFRVNWRWLERGFLTQPDMVFTGDRAAVDRVGDCTFCFRTVGDEIRVFRRRLLRPDLPRLRYLTYERTAGFLNGRDWGARPTNGAVMLATAVELRPRRLVIAGIDLFADPAGSYPGADDVPNAYVPVHDRETELAIIRNALDRHRGEVEIIGDVLRERLGLS